VVRAALDELRKQGIVVRIAGRGTFVLPPKVRQPVDELRGLQEMLGDRLVYELVDASVIPAPTGIAFTLGLPPGTEIYHLERLGRADGVRVVLTSTYIAVSVLPDLMSRDQRTMRRDLDAAGQSPETAIVELSAVAANPVVAALLGIESGEPLLFFRRVLSRADGSPVELCYSHYRSTAITLVSTPKRPTKEDS
jgi:GntR family transcriptional regulator